MLKLETAWRVYIPGTQEQKVSLRWQSPVNKSHKDVLELSETVPFNSAHQQWTRPTAQWRRTRGYGEQTHHYPYMLLQLKTSTSFQIFLPFTIFSLRKCLDSMDVLSPACIAEWVWGFGHCVRASQRPLVQASCPKETKTWNAGPQPTLGGLSRFSGYRSPLKGKSVTEKSRK